LTNISQAHSFLTPSCNLLVSSFKHIPDSDIREFQGVLQETPLTN
jgi:hypothetical protein